jgi:hypothetical protein
MNHEAEFRSWASKSDIPKAIVESIIRYAPSKEGFKSPVEVMAPQIFPLDDILRDQSRDYNDIDALADGLLIIGRCPNGDPIAIDIRQEPGSIWYISHEEMFGVPLRTVSIKVTNDIEEFVNQCENEQFPIDYFDARDV